MAITQVGTATTDAAFGSPATLEMSRPTGTTTGDLVCIVSVLTDSLSGLGVNETGWTDDTQITDVAGADKALTFSYKYITDIGSEPSTYTVDYTGADSETLRAVCFALRGVDSGTQIDAATQQNTGTVNSDTHDPAAITTVTNGAWVITAVGANQSDGNGVVPSGYTEIGQTGFSGSNLTVVGYKEKATAGSEDPGTFSGMSSTADSCSFTAAIRPASSIVVPIYVHHRKLIKAV